MVGCGGISSFRSWFDGQGGGENPSVTLWSFACCTWGWEIAMRKGELRMGELGELGNWDVGVPKAADR